jgi:hypothetical protein
MPYFPTENAWTQITRPSNPLKPTPSSPSATRQPWKPNLPPLRQSTIDFQHQQQCRRPASSQPPQDDRLHSLIIQSSQPGLPLTFGDSTPSSPPLNV